MAVRGPHWRIPPPNPLRNHRAFAMNSRLPTITLHVSRLATGTQKPADDAQAGKRGKRDGEFDARSDRRPDALRQTHTRRIKRPQQLSQHGPTIVFARRVESTLGDLLSSDVPYPRAVQVQTDIMFLGELGDPQDLGLREYHPGQSV